MKKSDKIPSEQSKKNILKKMFLYAFHDAAVSLSQLAHEEMAIDTTFFKLLTGEELMDKIQNQLEDPYCCSLIKSRGAIETCSVLLISRQEAIRLYHTMTHIDLLESDEMYADVISAVGEINNILSSSFINHLANKINQKITFTVPMNAGDMLGALMQGIIMQEELFNKKIYLADSIIKTKTKKQFNVQLMIMSNKDELLRMANSIKG